MDNRIPIPACKARTISCECQIIQNLILNPSKSLPFDQRHYSVRLYRISSKNLRNIMGKGLEFAEQRHLRNVGRIKTGRDIRVSVKITIINDHPHNYATLIHLRTL